LFYLATHYLKDTTLLKRTLTALAAAIIVAAPSAVVSPAEAGTPGCVTKREFRAVKKGWHRDRVHNRFDASGRIVSQGGGYVTREYRSCTDPRWSYISISYDSQRLDYKSAYWG
jgi:hypothetical protein